MMAIGAFFCLAGWNRPSIRPADPVKMTSGIGTSLHERLFGRAPRNLLTREQAARRAQRACRRNSLDLLKNLGRLRARGAAVLPRAGAFTTTGRAKSKTYDMA